MFEMGFKHSSWNFLEAGHDKGAPDGIGAVIKREADAIVHQGKGDIMNAKDLITNLTKTGFKIMFWLIEGSSIDHYDKRLGVEIRSFPETMKIHQILAKNKLHIAARVLSCFCNKDCECFQPMETSFQQAIDVPPSTELTVPVEAEVIHTTHEAESEPLHSLCPVTTVDEGLIGKFCVVNYDGLPYPGIILDVDDDHEMEVKVMCRIGPNRFFWPLIEDRLWYRHDKIITLLADEPAQVTKRHHQIDPNMWQAIRQLLDLDDQGKRN